MKEYFQNNKVLSVLMLFLSIGLSNVSQSQIRQSINLDNDWKTIAYDSVETSLSGFANPTFNDRKWKNVNVPHNWDAYEGYRRMRHGNRHGYAWYRKTFNIISLKKGKRYFLYFEGVGSYATVWLNNKKVGEHAGGRTTFTLDVTNEILTDGKANTLAVRADHPAFIKDLPWVCGGCSEERGFSEGSQPMGIFRPVQLLVTNEVRVNPFGVHIWNDTTASAQSAFVNITVDVKNYSAAVKNIAVWNILKDAKGNTVFKQSTSQEIGGNSAKQYQTRSPNFNDVHLWSLESSYLYSLETEVWEGEKMIDKVTSPYGIRTISWPIGKAPSSNQFFLNGKPVFINGIAEYEHLIGQSHAFTAEQVRTRVQEIQATGFNAFRDGHQPHNLRYGSYWDSLGILWWTQLSAHVWYDSPKFRNNFKNLLKEWVIERRNCPSVILWGLQNESKLPADFARECTALIRELDPTASSQRKVTTCNGGEGTDWDVPQNWTGTYGGDPNTYASDVKRQVLIGEYGAWRTIDLHSEGAFQQNGILSEDRMTQLMETKVRLAESAKDSTAGQFFWLLTSHDNPGRVQGGEGYRELDRIGPVNYKGLLTPWEEPTDAFYMFRSNYVSNKTSPMVYIVSHTWPDRWLSPGFKSGITVYSNCDEVELFNDVNGTSLGKHKRGGIGTHFQWDNVSIQYNILKAIGYVNGKPLAEDLIILNHLPKAPNDALLQKPSTILQPQKEKNYIYRVNCGGPSYMDKIGNTWRADQALDSNNIWGSTSWTNDFKGMPSFFASQRSTNDPIAGTQDWPLFQDFRYGRDRLAYHFPVPNGDYLVELYFIEPWLGTGGGMDCKGWRMFDVAINGKTVIKNLDIWNEVGHDKALKKKISVHVVDGKIDLSFPNVASGQAVISAIAIAGVNNKKISNPASKSLIYDLRDHTNAPSVDFSNTTWMATGQHLYSDKDIQIAALPPVLFGADWLRTPSHLPNARKSIWATFRIQKEADVFIAMDSLLQTLPNWLVGFEDTKSFLQSDESGGKRFRVYRKRYPKDAMVQLGDNPVSASMYTVAVVPINTIEPAYDLKTITTYKAPQAKFLGDGLAKATVNEKDAVVFKKDNGDAIEWTITVGVADVYSLTVKYANTSKEKLAAKLELLTMDGTLMHTEQVELLPSNTGKWNYYTGSTGSMINAGIYHIRLTALHAQGVSVSGLDVQ